MNKDEYYEVRHYDRCQARGEKMVISGHVKDNMIILDEKVRLPDGIKVIITIPERITKKSSGLCGIWKDGRSAEEIADEVISSRSQGRKISL